MKIGIDAGGTLIKVAYVNDGYRKFEKWPSTEVDALIEVLDSQYAHDELFLTGGKAEYMAEKLNQNHGVSIEFDATYRGLKTLMHEQSVDLDRFVYLNVGTGTSFHHASPEGQERVGGSGVGGGTLLGLSKLLVDIDDYTEIIQLAETGNRDAIDLKVHHIYGGRPTPIPGDLTASNFGNVMSGEVAALEPADKLQAVIGLVAETVTAVGISLAEGYDTTDIVFIGSTLLDNKVMQEIINRYAGLKGARAHIIADGEYSGALGAIL
ncbi:type II pantothenate kinase [Salinicoccus hispanicus]|uniref:Type II pantothenate kinase n=1 Tax=Salinicoccus hispanicus TaxID=157225 RepID=A0A6N8U054_9STAP|nr:type II pantothenate kinase [Salinicoccus hispanicus]MXQ51163.1 type II pantothenate kinase [Salinicoccus hispanicus]